MQESIVGVGDLVLELAEALEPFFQWMSGTYEDIPEPLRGEFVSAVLLEGEPGSGKTSICEAIAQAFERAQPVRVWRRRRGRCTRRLDCFSARRFGLGCHAASGDLPLMQYAVEELPARSGCPAERKLLAERWTGRRDSRPGVEYEAVDLGPTA